MQFVGETMNFLVSKMTSYGQIAYAEAGNVVEQTVGGIRMVASFTGEKHAIEKDNNKLKIAYKAPFQQGLASGLGFGVMVCVIYASYGLSIWYRSKLIIEKGYNGGRVIVVMFNLLTSGM
uniref:ABC transmembrane type-1 domain-containing protein n=1 Tax=Rhizophora mucronata TaxID=61149 RepID=A0A2P2MWW4_RHIMU